MTAVMTRLEHSVMDGKRPANSQSNPSTTSQPASLGPVDPSWLAKLSGTLGIQPARTVAPLLMSIWPGVHTAAICCREACAYLMQADMHHVAMPQLESNVRVAFRQRGVSVHPSLSIRSEIEADSHFIKEQGPNGGDLMVRLDKTSLPAPAVASLYLNGTGERMLPPERALYQAAMHLTWPRALTDDDEYLCCQISELLLEDVERVGIDRNLPRHAMHLTEVGGALRQRSEFDPRLAVIFPKGQVAKSRRPRLSEFLGKEDLKPFFRVVESRLRQSEKVVTLRTDVLLRSLGPMASVLQKSLCPVLKDGLPQPQPEHPRAANDQVHPMHAPSFPLPIPNLSDQPHPPGRKSDALGDVMSPATGRESCWSYSGPSNDPLQSRHDSVSQSFTRAQSIFMGLESASEVPIEIRNCWSTIEDDTLQHDDSLLPHGAPSYPGRSFSSHRRSCGPPGPRGEGQEDPSAENALLAIAPLRAVDRTGGSSGTGTFKPTTEPSDFFSFGSEDMSDAGGTAVPECSAPEGVRGSSNPVDGAASNGGASHSWNPALGSVATPSSSGRANGGGVAGWNKRSDPHQSPPVNVGMPAPSVTRGPSSFTGSQGPISINDTNVLLDSGNLQSVDRKARFSLGTTTDDHTSVWEKGGVWGTPGGTRGEALHACSRSHAAATEGLPPHLCGSLGNQSDDVAAKSIWGSPASLLHGPSPAHPPMQQQQVVNGSNANYAAALRSAQPAGMMANRQAHSPTDAKVLTNEVIYAHLDTCGREIHSLLTPAVVDSICDAVRRAAPRLNAPGLLQVSMGMPSTVSATMPGGALGPVDVATEFLACVNAAALTRNHVANMLEKGSDGARRALVIAGLPPGTLPSSSIAHHLSALKPMVRREVVALVDAHPGALRLSHFDEGVMCHLQRRPEPLVAAALREISRRTDLAGATNKSAYLTHWLMRFADDPAIPSLASKCAGKGGNSTSPDLRRLPRSVQSSVERLVDSSPWIDWRHFDAGVMKVLQQLASTAESDAVSELRQVEVTELSTVKNMPAYLNKCFNNRLWKVRES